MEQTNSQDMFLSNIMEQNIPVTIFLMNGFQMHGYIDGFDSDSILMKSDGVQNMIFKHAISTIKPARHVECNSSERHV